MYNFSNQWPRRFLLVFFDLIILSIVLFIIDENSLDIFISSYLQYIGFCLFALVIYVFSGQYKGITRFSNSNYFYSILLRNIFLIFFKGLLNLSNNVSFDFLNYLSGITFLILFQSGYRLILRDIYFKVFLNNSKKKENVVIYGTNIESIQLASSLRINKNYSLKAFLSFDKHLIGQNIFGIPISSGDFFLDNKLKVDRLILPNISLPTKIIKKLENLVSKKNIKMFKFPSVEDLLSEKLSLDKMFPISIDNLLGRNIVPPVMELMSQAINGNCICITGAGGSIGSELCRQINNLNPKKIVLIDNSELNLYKISKELEIDNKKNNVISILGNVCDEVLIKKTFLKYQIDIIFHASAYKHVPIVEKNPIQGIENNILGTYSICKQAIECQVKKFILISTDKAVRPTNIMGATKRCAELIVQAYAGISNKTIFSMVRFGNVLESSGSVVPLFKEQIGKGGPITLTHPEIIRYFMTIKEASQLVIQAASLSRGGEVFLLDMGKPIPIIDLAKNMIELAGLKVKDSNNTEGDIEIKITGLRPGEKLFEELLINNDSSATNHPKIFCSKERKKPADELFEKLKELKIYKDNQNKNDALKLLAEIVEEWVPNKGLFKI